MNSKSLKKVFTAILPGIIVAGLIFAANTYYDLDLGKVIIQEITKIIGMFETTATTTLATLSGSVGIATTLPAYTLDVAGNVRLGASTSTEIVFRGYIQSSIIPYNTDEFTLGTPDFRWSNLYSQGASIGEPISKITISTSTIEGTATTTIKVGSAQLVLSPDGKITLGFATSTPTVFQSYIQSDLVPYSDLTHSLGLSNFRWANLYVGNILGTGNLTIQGESSLATTTISTQLAVPKIVSSGNLTIDPAENLVISKSTSILGDLSVSGTTTTTQLSVTSTSTLGTVISGIWQGSVISTKYGGTGNDWSNQATGSLPYFSDTGTLSTLPIGAQNTVLISSGSFPQWSSSLNLAGTLAVSGTSTLATTTLSRLTITELTPGSVLFAGSGGLISQDNANLFWDNTNKRLGIGTSSPAYTLDINGTLRVSSTSTLANVLPLQDITYILGSPTLRWANIYAATGTFGSTITIGSDTIQGSATTTLFTGSNTNQLVLGANGLVGINAIPTPPYNLYVLGQCVTGDTRLKRRKKKKQSSEYIFDEVEIKDVQPGDEILTLDEKTGKFVWRKVRALLFMGKKPVFELQTEDGRKIRTTANHPYYVRNTQKLKAGIFIDDANLFYGFKKYGWRVDLRKIKDLFSQYFELKFVNYYISLPKKEDSAFQKTIQYIEKIKKEVNLITKPLKYIFDEEKREFVKKGDVDLEIAIDVLKHLSDLDVVIILSGDSDFKKLAETVLKEGKRIFFVGYEGNMAWELRQLHHIYLDDIREFVDLALENKKAPAKTGVPLLSSYYQNQKGLSRGRWVKVANLKPGMEIGVYDENGVKFVKIAKIEAKGVEEVYDIEVEDTHNFVGNDIVAHNTYISATTSLAASGGNVGIGTTAPVSLLELYKTNASPILTITSATSTTYSPQIAFRTGVTPSNKFILGVDIGDSNKFKIATSTFPSTAVLTIDSSGKVGIGTTSPAYTLDVAGDINLPATGLIRIAGNAGTVGQYLKRTDTGLTWATVPSVEAGTAEGQVLRWDATANNWYPTSTITIATTTNVGIGITSPSQKLTVAGNIGLQAGANAFIGTLDNYALSLRTNNTDRIFITNTGNVGIGTTTPVATLEVAGTLRLKPMSQSEAGTCDASRVGTIYYDSAKKTIYHCDGTQWTYLIAGQETDPCAMATLLSSKNYDDAANIVETLDASFAAEVFMCTSNISTSTVAGILNSSNLSISKAASIMNQSALTVDRAAAVFNDSNLTISTAVSILTDANLSAGKAQSIMYAMTDYAKQIDIITYGASDETISSNASYSSTVRRNNLTINSGYTLSLSAQPNIIIANTLTNYGTMDKTQTGGAGGARGGGAGGLGGTGGGGAIIIVKNFVNSGTIQANGGAGGNASTGSNGSGGTGGAGSINRIGTHTLGSGGSGGMYNGGGGGPNGAGSDSTGYPGGSGGSVTYTTINTAGDLYHQLRKAAIDWWLQNVASKTPSTITPFPNIYGSGGGGGGSSAPYSASGGGGGGSGGQVIVLANSLNNTGTIKANGGNGGNGWNYGGGGGGGGGGIVYLLYRTTLQSAGTLQVAGGSGGSGGSNGSAGSAGGTGVATTYSVSGADIAENYPTDDPTISAGDLVRVKSGVLEELGGMLQGQNFLAEKFLIEKTSKPYDPQMIGVISVDPAIILGEKGKENLRAVALVGRVPVKVTTKNGEIKVGDYITSSDIPGVGMKATKPGRVIGIALESYSGPPDEIGWVTVFMNPHFALGSVNDDGDLETLLAQISPQDIEKSNQEKSQSLVEKFISLVQAAISKLGMVLENGVAKLDKILSKEIVAEKARFNTLEMVDLSSGEIYCLWLENGEWRKEKGECNALISTTTQQEATSTPQITPTPSPTQTLEPTSTPQPTPSPEPSQTPTPSPTPELSPTPSPTPTLSPQPPPESTPTPTPTPEPTPTEQPTPTPSPSSTPDLPL